jgi:hypothetical protein
MLDGPCSEHSWKCNQRSPILIRTVGFDQYFSLFTSKKVFLFEDNDLTVIWWNLQDLANSKQGDKGELMLQLLAKLRHSIRVSCKVLSEINNQKETASRSSGFQSEETLQPSIHVCRTTARLCLDGGKRMRKVTSDTVAYCSIFRLFVVIIVLPWPN